MRAPHVLVFFLQPWSHSEVSVRFLVTGTNPNPFQKGVGCVQGHLCTLKETGRGGEVFSAMKDKHIPHLGGVVFPVKLTCGALPFSFPRAVSPVTQGGVSQWAESLRAMRNSAGVC